MEAELDGARPPKQETRPPGPPLRPFLPQRYRPCGGARCPWSRGSSTTPPSRSAASKSDTGASPDPPAPSVLLACSSTLVPPTPSGGVAREKDQRIRALSCANGDPMPPDLVPLFEQGHANNNNNLGTAIFGIRAKIRSRNILGGPASSHPIASDASANFFQKASTMSGIAHTPQTSDLARLTRGTRLL